MWWGSAMKTLFAVLAAYVAVTMTMTGPSIRAEGAHADDTHIKLTGCLVKGEGDDGYLVTNLPSEPGAASAAGTRVIPSAVGTAGVYETIFYWLDDDNGLARHVGHRVEVEGRLKGDPKGGEIKLERKDNWTEVRVKSNGRSMKAEVPNAFLVPASPRDKERKMTALVRRVDVDHVKMLSAICE